MTILEVDCHEIEIHIMMRKDAGTAKQLAKDIFNALTSGPLMDKIDMKVNGKKIKTNRL